MLRRTMLRRALSTAAAYDATLKNLTLTSSTCVIYQGFTGQAATLNARATIQYGTHVVGGVTPGRSGSHLGLPLLPSVKAAAQLLKPDATAIFVAAPHCAAAIEEALEAEIPLLVAVAEHVPVHDVLRVHAMLQTQSRSRLVGANCPGIISPGARCRVGFVPHPSFLPGVVGIVAKSGTLSYEAVDATTRAGLGQSAVIGVGGDWVAGTTLAEGVSVFLEDEATQGIVVIGEIGGDAELEVAEVVKGARKPVMALVAGETEVKGTAMGHAGAIRVFGDFDAAAKRRALADAGVTVVTHPGEFGDGMLRLLGRKRPSVPVQGMGPGPFEARRAMHTAGRATHTAGSSSFVKGQEAAQLLMKHTTALPLVPEGAPEFFISISIDRSARQPCLVLTQFPATHSSVPFPYTTGPDRSTISSALRGLHPTAPQLRRLTSHIETAWTAHLRLRSYILTLPFTSTHDIPIPHLSLLPDAAAPGLLYIPLPGPGRIGTLVNGAGLAMNTVDALQRAGGEPGNFLDTGGKASEASVRDAMVAVLADSRVRVVLVNVFGGLTDCRTVARGVVAAVIQEGRATPVVVRLRGTEEEEAQMVLLECAGNVLPIRDFEAAVRRAVELAR